MTTETKTLKLTKAQSELIESLKAQAEAAEHHPALSQLVDASYTEATRAWQEAGETGAMGYYRGRRAAFGEIKAELDRLIAAGSKADGT